MAAGKVYLIGAGPGDVELLTLKAVRALGEADVVLIDDLVNRDVLRFIRPEAQLVDVGKRGHCKSTPQESINRQLVEFARAGKTVARLKGGDPFIFGRGGEEMQHLVASGVTVEIVSGITAGIAVPAALGIPLSHRDFAPSITFVTGHASDGRTPNWRVLAEAGGTLVIYMGLANLPRITDALLAAGLPPTTPAVRVHEIASPAIIVVGNVVTFAPIYAQNAKKLQELA